MYRIWPSTLLLPLGLMAQGVDQLHVKTIPLASSRTECEPVERTLPVPPPPLLSEIAEAIRGPVPVPASPFLSPIPQRKGGDADRRVVWTIRAMIQPSFTEDLDFTFVSFEDGHVELIFAKALLVNYWDQLYGNTELLGKQLSAESISERLLHYRWVFDSRSDPEVAKFMIEARSLKKGLNYGADDSGMDGTTYTFEIRATDGDFRATQWERAGANEELVDWSERCHRWLDKRLASTWEQDFKGALARMDKIGVGPRILLSCLQPDRLREAGWVLDAGVKVDAPDDEGTTPLMAVTEHLDEQATRFLLDHKADPDLQDNCGRTALHRLAGRSRTGDADGKPKEIMGIAKLLLAAGARTDIKDSRGRTARDLAVANGQLELAKTLFR